MIDYFFSVLSPYSYFGADRFHDLVRRYRVRVVYKPVQVPELYAATGGVMVQNRAPPRQAYRLQDMARMSDYLGIPLKLHPKHWPTDPTLASRMILAAQARGLDPGPMSTAFLRAVWSEERDIAERDVLADIATASGLDAQSLIATAETPEFDGSLSASTEEAIRRGIFGFPTYALGDQLFWGQDRLDVLEWSLKRK